MNDPEKTAYDTICIIGNGFDLNLEFPTSYYDFIQSPHFKVLVNSNNHLAEELQKAQNLTNWIDVENELVNYSVRFGKSLPSFKQEFRNLSEKLIDHLKSIDFETFDELKPAYQLLSKIRNNYALLIDFNYTPTISIIEKHLKVSTVNFEHVKIHGSINKMDIIIGVQDDVSLIKEHIFFKKSVNLNYNPINFSNKMKLCKNLIIFGHSLGETDHMYFKSFFEETSIRAKNDKRNIFIFYYGEESYDRIAAQLDILTNKNISGFRMNNNVEFVDLQKNVDFSKIEKYTSSFGDYSIDFS